MSSMLEGFSSGNLIRLENGKGPGARWTFFFRACARVTTVRRPLTRSGVASRGTTRYLS